jgi:FlaG/FlaF family flagellin (archaellin)
MKAQNELAVSPVVGVMLMLVVVIIIAAVISGFAGNLVNSNNQKAPQLQMDIQIQNSGYWSTSYFKGQVTGVDSPIPTSRLKLVTSWTAKDNNKAPVKGGATTLPNVPNTHFYGKAYSGSEVDTWTFPVPFGYGSGLGNGTRIKASFWGIDQYEGTYNMALSGCTMEWVMNGINGAYNHSWYGNYKLQPGTYLLARPHGGLYGGISSGTSSQEVGYGVTPNATQGGYGGGRYNYAYGQWTNPGRNDLDTDFEPYPTTVDQMQAVLGENWQYLRAGDIVNVKFIDIPTGKTILNKDVTVTGAV